MEFSHEISPTLLLHMNIHHLLQNEHDFTKPQEPTNLKFFEFDFSF